MEWVIIISEVLIVLFSAVLSAFVSYGMFKLEWRKKMRLSVIAKKTKDM